MVHVRRTEPFVQNVLGYGLRAARRQADFGVSGDGIDLVYQRLASLAVGIASCPTHGRAHGGHESGDPAQITVEKG